MEREVMWTPWQGPGIEHLRLTRRDDAIIADGVVIGVEENAPFRLRYTVTCDAQWYAREVDITLLDSDRKRLLLRADGAGQWMTPAGEAISSLGGCLDVDISATPFTNTLPIRRLALHPGEARDLSIVYVSVPDLAVTVDGQRYTCLERQGQGGLYLYESLDSAFRADLRVDADGLVLDYPGLFRRVWPPFGDVS